MRVRDKITIITGSTKGIGRGAAERFAREGAKVVVSGRSETEGQALVEQICSAGGTAIFVRCDVSVESDCRNLVDATVAEFGRVDVLVNNAAPIEFMGGGGDDSVVGLTEENLDYIVKVGLYGSIWCCKYAIPHMQAVGGGSIVMVSSVAGLQGLSKAAGYTAVKGAIDALTRQIAVEFGPDNIRCNCVVIGFVAVGQLAGMVAAHPTLGKLWADATLTRPSSLEDVANAMLYLSSDDSGSTTGVLLPVDGGILVQSPLPGSDRIIGALSTSPQG